MTDVPGYRHLREPGHAFLNGARGSGKSMIFRYLEPDCQLLEKQCRIQDLPFIGLYISNKGPNAIPTELAFDSLTPANILFNEHALSLHVLKHAFSSLEKKVVPHVEGDGPYIRLKELFREVLIYRLQLLGWEPTKDFDEETSNAAEIFKKINSVLDGISYQLGRYIKGQIANRDTATYSGPIIGFSDFVAPLFSAMVEREVFGKAKIFLLMDDADEMPLRRTEILNNWIFARTTGFLSIKAATAFKYPTFLTTSNRRIETPHDFADINISDIYTSDKYQGYKTRVSQICERRIRRSQIGGDIKEMFPTDTQQDEKIKQIYNELVNDWDENGRGARARDDGYRYATAEYITQLGGSRKQSGKFLYAGFDNLVDLSSGVVRDFLDAATAMYDLACQKAKSEAVDVVPSAIQSQVSRVRGDEKIANIANELKSIRNHRDGDVIAVRNLIAGLGSLFKEILRSDRAERRVFSFAISDEPDEELVRIINLAIELGLIQTSTIGRKEGFGRTRLYVLTRQIAPAFNLDPSGFAGYKFLTSRKIWELMGSPTRTANILRTRSAGYFTEDNNADLFAVEPTPLGAKAQATKGTQE
ncbi:hypothetical protein ACA106_02140 [Agrobacterium pusense]|uniref:ORC-CDC6 family AAA ATPase n=1 Tax=Agrobacterium pusense TaxID=648995 RepID=UPI0035A71C40